MNSWDVLVSDTQTIRVSAETLEVDCEEFRFRIGPLLVAAFNGIKGAILVGI